MKTIKQRFDKFFRKGFVSLTISQQDDTTIYIEKKLYAFIASELELLADELVTKGEIYEPAYTEPDERISETYKSAAAIIRAHAKDITI